MEVRHLSPSEHAVTARRMEALFRHLQPFLFTDHPNSGMGIKAVPVSGFSTEDWFPALRDDGNKELVEPYNIGDKEQRTSENDVELSKVFVQRETRATEPSLDLQLSVGLDRIGSGLGDGESEAAGESKVAGEREAVGDPGYGETYRFARKKVILIVGAGDATGGAVAKKFAKEGYVACIVRRQIEKLKPLADEISSNGGLAYSFGVDARREEEMVALVEHIEVHIGEIQVVVFNIGANVQFSILETTSRVYSKVWEMACFAGFLTGREVAKRMVPRNEGTIIFTGATASMRGGSGFAAFAGAKFGLRALAQSMARELGPKGIHVAHVVVDAAIDTPWTRKNSVDFDSRVREDGVVQPDDIAELYWQLQRQPRRAWTHEIDLRPHNEPW